MMFADPLLSYSTYWDENTSPQFGLDILDQFYQLDNNQIYQAMFWEYVQNHQNISTPLINIKAQNLTWESKNTQIDELRATEKELIGLDGNEFFLAVFDLRFATRMTAGLSIAKTSFVCAVLGFGSLLFSKDAHEIVILPIE